MHVFQNQVLEALLIAAANKVRLVIFLLLCQNFKKARHQYF
jgi:hypothetical protein